MATQFALCTLFIIIAMYATLVTAVTRTRPLQYHKLQCCNTNNEYAISLLRKRFTAMTRFNDYSGLVVTMPC